ncbi:MAG: chemotaxis protein CheW [Actinobacteria bacterium]|nr:chemotaxis protein CheW [Actinomycetota bacterium]
MEDKKTNEATIRELVTFKVAEEEFAVDILKVQEIIRMIEITRIPRTPEFVEGVINLRGKVIPVIDFRKRFNIQGKEEEKDTRIIVTDIGGKTLGFIVDSVSEVLRIPLSSIEPPPPVIAGIESEYINGVGKLDDRLLILINLDKLLLENEKMIIEKN